MLHQLDIQHLGTRPKPCAALEMLRERGCLEHVSPARFTRSFRAADGNTVLLSARGGHVVAALSRHRRALPWVALLREDDSERLLPWMQGPRSRPWVKRVFSGADAVVVHSDCAKGAWQRWLPEAQDRIFRVYPHIDRSGIEEEARVQARSPIRLRVAPVGRERFELGVFKSVLAAFLQRCPELRDSIELSMEGPGSGEDQAWAKRVGIRLFCKTNTPGDVLVLLDRGNHPVTLPYGFFPALGSGRPVICLSRCSEAARVLAETGLGVSVDCSERGWAERGAYVIQSAVFRRALKRGVLAEYSPRPAAIASFSVLNYCSEIEGICRSVLAAEPKSLSAAPVDPQFAAAHVLEQRLSK